MEELLPVTETNITLTFNNKGLKMLFVGTKVTKKSLKLGELDPKVLSSMIKSADFGHRSYTNFQLMDLDLEGEFDKWDLLVKLKLY